MALDLQKSAGRQWPLVAKMPFSYEDLADHSGEALAAVIMPVNSRVIGGSFVITEAFNSGTSDAFEVGDASDEDRYLAGADGTLGHDALVPTEHKYTGKEAVTLKWTGDGAAPTAGEGVLTVEYVIDDRATEVQPAVLQT